MATQMFDYNSPAAVAAHYAARPLETATVADLRVALWDLRQTGNRCKTEAEYAPISAQRARVNNLLNEKAGM